MRKTVRPIYTLVGLGLIAVSAAISPSVASAGDVLTIVTPSTVKFAVQDNKVYLRNLNDYDPTWLGCCYNYYFDLSTEGGKAMFSTFLSYRLTGQRIMFYKTNWTTAGPIEIVGSL